MSTQIILEIVEWKQNMYDKVNDVDETSSLHSSKTLLAHYIKYEKMLKLFMEKQKKKEEDHVEKMKNIMGSFWFMLVENTDNDCITAQNLREESEESHEEDYDTEIEKKKEHDEYPQVHLVF